MSDLGEGFEPGVDTAAEWLKPIRPRATWVLWLGVLLILAEGVFVAHSWAMYRFYGEALMGFPGYASDADVDAMAAQLDSLAGGVGILYLTVLIAGFIAGGMWVHRAALNAGRIDPDPRRITPGWAVGWHAVPFANLWLPLKAMKQTWVTSLGRRDIDATEMPGRLILWWVLWIVSNGVGNLSGRGGLSDDLERVQESFVYDFVNAPITIACALAWLSIVRVVTRAQEEARLYGPDATEPAA